MIELRDMQLMVALAQHQHFARAAVECGISQPAFSMRIRNLETKLGVAVVKRGNRFQGFTEQGDLFLIRARRLLDDARALEQEVGAVPGQIHGTLTLGAVPTALAFAARISSRLHIAHSGIVTSIQSRSSTQILEGLEDRTLDAGLTYADAVTGGTVRATPLYDETYALVAPVTLAPRLSGAATWLEAAALPLCLLDPRMQNRRILDQQFKDIGQKPDVIAESNSFTAALVMVAEGLAATILPESLSSSIGSVPGAVCLPLTEPDLAKSICMVTPREAQGLPTVDALRSTIELLV